MINLPEAVSFIIEELDKNGYEGFIVGGCVRDSLMNVVAHDYDITTDALPEQVKEIFPKTYDTGIAHGTVSVRIGKELYEVTTYRIDGEYKDGRHPETVMFTNKIEQDLSRRDFTMNAIAYNSKTGFVDFFDGMTDIAEKIIRGVGDPTKRFNEDGLRMLRCLRFSAQLGFEIEAKTLEALKETAYLIEKISIERITSEISKMILSEHLDKLPLLYETGLLEHVIKGSSDYFKENGLAIIESIKKSDREINLRLALGLRFLSPSRTKDILKYLRFDNNTISIVTTLVEHIYEELSDDFYSVRKGMSSLGPDRFYDILRLKAAILEDPVFINSIKEKYDAIMQNQDCLSLKDLKIDGTNLKSLGIPNGKKIGNTLNKLLDIVLHDPSKNEFDKLKSYISLD